MKKQYCDLYTGKEQTIIIKKSKIWQLPFKNLFKQKKVIKPRNQKKSSKSFDITCSINHTYPRKVIKSFKNIKHMLGFSMLITVILLSFQGISQGLNTKNNLENFGKLALSQIKNGGAEIKKGQFDIAIQNFLEAENLFFDAEKSLSPLVNNSSDLFRFNGDAETADNIIKAAREINSAMLIMTNLISKNKNINQNLDLTTNFLTMIIDLENQINQINTHLNEAEQYLIKCQNNAIPKTIQSDIYHTELILQQIISVMNQAKEIFPGIKILLGMKHPHTILILLQNSHEIRANGGFIGSLLFVTFTRGQISNYTFRDVYDLDSELFGIIEPPKPFKKLAKSWGLRDANYFPDFSKSAEQIQWFLEREQADSVDTIIAINEQVIENILLLTGPLTLPIVNESVDHKNFSTILSFFVEAKIFGHNTPKRIIAEFLPIFIENLNKLNKSQIIETMINMIKEKHIYAYSFRPETQIIFDSFNLSGKTEYSPQIDFLNIVQTSISANKSDGFINEKISHKSIVNLEGAIINTVEITRSSDWSQQEDELFYRLFDQYGGESLRDQESLHQILGAGKNQVWTRIYVPYGAKIIKVQGLDSNEIETTYENNKTIFSFYYPGVLPENPQTIQLSYTQPERLNFSDGFDSIYFCFEKSAGITKNEFTKTLDLEKGLSIIENPDLLPFEGEIKSDKCFSVLIAKDSYVY